MDWSGHGQFLRRRSGRVRPASSSEYNPRDYTDNPPSLVRIWPSDGNCTLGHFATLRLRLPLSCPVSSHTPRALFCIATLFCPPGSPYFALLSSSLLRLLFKNKGRLHALSFAGVKVLISPHRHQNRCLIVPTDRRFSLRLLQLQPPLHPLFRSFLSPGFALNYRRLISSSSLNHRHIYYCPRQHAGGHHDSHLDLTSSLRPSFSSWSQLYASHLSYHLPSVFITHDTVLPSRPGPKPSPPRPGRLEPRS